MFVQATEVKPKPINYASKDRLLGELKAAMVAWGAAHNNLSQAWAVGSERDDLQQSLDEALRVRESARADYRRHREEHGC
jgi:hypothetical protein